MSSPIVDAIKKVCAEKGITYEAVVESIEAALAAAYRKDFGSKGQNVVVTFKPETGESDIFEVKNVIEDLDEKTKKYLDERTIAREKAEIHPIDASEDPADKEFREKAREYNPKMHLQLSEATLIDPNLKVGDELKTKLVAPGEYGRMAAQTAKQVIIQKLREAERSTIFDEFKSKEGEVMQGTISRKEGKLTLVDLGRVTGILPIEEQVSTERYQMGQRLKVFVKSVNLGQRGPEIVLSRASPEIVIHMFHLEIPEIANGSIEIKAIAREPGYRTKIAVEAMQENIDPIGSCVGQRGSRIQTIIHEIGGEKIDIIEHEEKAETFIANALLPAKVQSVVIDEKTKEAKVHVADDQLSIAIGKEGQNVRLASRLTGWKISIAAPTEAGVVVSAEPEVKAEAETPEVKPEVKPEEVVETTADPEPEAVLPGGSAKDAEK